MLLHLLKDISVVFLLCSVLGQAVECFLGEMVIIIGLSLIDQVVPLSLNPGVLLQSEERFLGEAYETSC